MMIFILIIFTLAILLILFNKRAVPVFLYHQVNPISSSVSPEIFEEHLKIIKKYNMETITISEYYNKNINKNSMLLTFDDGYYDNFKYVFPLLKKYNMKATIFLNTLYIMDKRENEPEIKDNNTVNLEAIKKYIENGKATINQYMSWEEIKEMYDSGLIDFQAHSHKHMAIFTDTKIEGLTKKDRMEAPELYLYGELEDDFPIFAKRGEYSGKANSEGRYSIPVNDPHEGTIVAGRQSMYDKISSDIVTTIVGMAKGEKPTINEVKSNHTFVTGKGLAGSRIKILLEDGQIYTADVDTNGDYRVVIPAQQTGKKIIARQLTPRRMESDEVETIVVRAMPAPKPTINEMDTDDTRLTGRGVPNSKVYVKIPGKLERHVDVNGNGDWEIDTGLLEAGKEIIAYQELPDRPNSEEVKRTVVQLPALRNT